MPLTPILIGAGVQGAGTTAAGGYYPLPPNGDTIVYPDPSTGIPQTGRRIDPRTHSISQTAGGSAYGMSTMQQLVEIAWGTIDATKFPKTFDSSYAQQVTSLYEGAVQTWINQRMMRIDAFVLTRFGSNGLKVEIRWSDLTSGTSHSFIPR